MPHPTAVPVTVNVWLRDPVVKLKEVGVYVSPPAAVGVTTTLVVGR